MENPNQFNDQSVISIGDWVVTMILLCIPVVNFIMLCIWAFGNSTPPSKANFAKASLIFYVIGLVLFIAMWGSIIAAFSSAF